MLSPLWNPSFSFKISINFHQLWGSSTLKSKCALQIMFANPKCTPTEPYFWKVSVLRSVGNISNERSRSCTVLIKFVQNPMVFELAFLMSITWNPFLWSLPIIVWFHFPPKKSQELYEGHWIFVLHFSKFHSVLHKTILFFLYEFWNIDHQNVTSVNR